MAKKGVVNIHGKEYKTVIMRVNEFREKFKPDDGWCIRTWLIKDEDNRVIVQASICDKDDHVVATGFAEEDRSFGKINKTSAVENCETSAIGRCLSAFGLGGEEYCSADELVSAIAQQDQQPQKMNLVAPVIEEPKKTIEDQHKEAVKEKPDAKKRIIKYLEKLAELVGEDEAQRRKTELFGGSKYTHGQLNLDMVVKKATVTELWRLSDEVKEMYTKAAEEE